MLCLRHLKSEILHRYNRNWLKNKDIIRLACSEQAARWIHGDSVTEKGREILKYENGYVKRDTTEEIKKKGYNIQTITKRLEDIYLNNKN